MCLSECVYACVCVESDPVGVFSHPNEHGEIGFREETTRDISALLSQQLKEVLFSLWDRTLWDKIIWDR